jgi:DNA-binding NarL/FixJ family response regulator
MRSFDRFDPGNIDTFGTDACFIIIANRSLIRDCFMKGLKDAGDDKAVPFATLEAWRDAAANFPDPVLLLATGASRSDEIAPLVMFLKAVSPDAPIVLLSDLEEAEDIVDAFALGVHGLIPMSLPLQVAIEALHLVRAGGVFMPPCLLDRRQAQVEHSRAALDPHIFTPRQASVLEALRQGKANKIIAYELAMCESTVKVHVRNIMRKLNAHNRTEVAFLTTNLDFASQSPNRARRQ